MGFFDFLKPLAGAVPVAGPLLQGLLGGFQGSAQNNAAKAQAQAYNDWLAQRQTGVNDLLSKLQGQGWDPFGVNTLSSTNWQQGTADTDTRQQMRKVVDPAQAAGKKALENQIFGRLGTAAVAPSEQIRAVKAVNDAFENAMQGARDMAGIKGLGPVAGLGASQGVNAQRASQIANYLGQVVPELTRKRQFEDEGAANALLNAWQGQNTNTQQRQIQNMMGGGTSQQAPDMNALANLFLPPSPQATGQTGQNPWLNAGADALGALMQTGQNQGWWGNKPQPVSTGYNPNSGFNWTPVNYQLGQPPR